MRFAEPWWLLLILLSVPLGVAGLRWLQAMSRVRAWSAVLLRAALIALLALALAGASTVRRTNRFATVFLVDVSESVQRFGGLGGAEGDAARRVRAWIDAAAEARGPDDLLAVVQFDSSARAVAAPTRGVVPDAPFTGVVEDGLPAGTNLEDALRYAGALIPPGARGRIVLVSDGVETAGDAEAAADALASGAGRGAPTPVDVVPIAYQAQREVAVESVDAPPVASESATVAVRVSLRAEGPTEGVLRLLRDGVEVDIDDAAEGLGRRIAFGPGRRVEVIPVKLLDGRVHRFEAVFEPDEGSGGALAGDTLAANNRGEAFTITPGKGSVLLIDGVSEGRPGGAGLTLAAALMRSGIETEIVPPSAAPGTLLGFHEHDLVILENVPADELPRSTQEALADYVEDLGGGLIMVGGPASFGAGGWKGSPLEPILPVRLDLPEKLIVPSVAIVFVLDASGSMAQPVLGGRRSQQQIANEGAAAAVLSLDKMDLVGVIAFANTHRDVVPLGPNVDPAAAAERVRSIASGGGTNLYPALERAGRILLDVEAQVKHVVVLSDGQAQGAPETGMRIASDLLAQDITVSTIAVGDGADVVTLEEIAVQGGGQFYQVVDPNLLPRIFLRETRIARAPMIREGEFQPLDTGSGSPITLGLPAPIPPLYGLVLTQRREAPGVVDGMLSPSGEPVLAHWNVGLGRVGAFTSDAHAWARSWLSWPGYQQFWSQAARTLARPESSRGMSLVATPDSDGILLRVDAYDLDGAPIDLLTITGTVFGPDGSREEVTLLQTGPGEYEGRAALRAEGSSIVALTPRLGDRAFAPVVGGVSRPPGPELRRVRSDEALLRRIADRTGGRVFELDLPDGAAVFERRGAPPAQAGAPLWPILIAWAIAVMICDVGTRRIAWDRLLTREARADLDRLAASAKGGAVGALRTARERGAERDRMKAPARAPARTTGSSGPERPAPVDAPARQRPAVSPDARAPADDAKASEEGGAASLLAAKRRARERYGSSGSAPDGGAAGEDG